MRIDHRNERWTVECTAGLACQSAVTDLRECERIFAQKLKKALDQHEMGLRLLDTAVKEARKWHLVLEGEMTIEEWSNEKGRAEKNLWRSTD